MKIVINQCPNGEWYRDIIGHTIDVVDDEINYSASQGIPEDVYWVRTGDAFNTLNYVRAADVSVVPDTAISIRKIAPSNAVKYSA